MSTLQRRSVKLVPLCDTSFITMLRSFKSVLSTSVGPSGHFKLLVSGGGYIQLTSSSRHLTQHQDQFRSPIIELIVQIIKSQPDFGFYTGVLITGGLESQLSLQNNNVVTRKQSTALFNLLLNTCDSVIDKLKIKINFDCVSDFIPIVRTILESKPGVFSLHDNHIMCLCLQIIKAFLFTLDAEIMLIGSTVTLVYKGRDECKFLPGIVYQLTDDDDWVVNILEDKSRFKGLFKTLLFTTSLDNADEGASDPEYKQNLRLPKIYEILEKAVTLGVHLIVCQKVVHSDIVMFLRKRSVIVLERLGTSLAKTFQQVTASFPVCNVEKLSVDELERFTGSVTSLGTFNFNKRRFILMEAKGATSGTLLINSSNIAGTEQAQILVDQALRALRSLVRDPFVLPGAGCFEMSYFILVQELCKEKNLNCKWLLNVLKEAAGVGEPIQTNSTFNHAWMTDEANEPSSSCNCRLVSRDAVSNGVWYTVPSSTNPDEQIDISYKCVVSNQIKLTSDAVVDSSALKRNSLLTSFETCINLLNIGTVVFKETE